MLLCIAFDFVDLCKQNIPYASCCIHILSFHGVVIHEKTGKKYTNHETIFNL